MSKKYIDADALIEKIVNTPSKVARTVKSAGMLTKLADRQFEILNTIEEMPAADVEPVEHGEWKEHGAMHEYFWVCSSCGFPSEALAAPELYKYCPNCGTKMDGGSE